MPNNPKPIDKSKKANHVCDKCLHWPDRKVVYPNGRPVTVCPAADGKPINYWNRCRKFRWNPAKTYLTSKTVKSATGMDVVCELNDDKIIVCNCCGKIIHPERWYAEISPGQFMCEPCIQNNL